MASFVKIADLPVDLGKKVHDLAADSLKIALSNTAPASETLDPTAAGGGILANVTQIAYASYSDDLAVDRVLDGVSWALAAGAATLTANDFTITASGGTLAPFRYLYIYNDTAPTKPLIACYDNAAMINLPDAASCPVDFGDDGGTAGTICTIA